MYKTLEQLNQQEVQDLLGEGVSLQKHDGYYLAQLDNGPVIGIGMTMPLDADGNLTAPIVNLTAEEEQKVRESLELPAEVHSLELFAGTYDGNGVFWFAQPGDLPTHTMVSLFYQPEIQSGEEAENAIMAFRKSSCLFGSWYMPAKGYLTKSLHVIKTPFDLWDTVKINQAGKLGKLKQAALTMLRLGNRKLVPQVG